MFKVIIVDDEKMIRSGIQNAIPWNSIGIEKAFTARSGEEALSVIREQKPDIMITDIKMGGMTGLELIDQAKKFVPEIRALVLTGYDEFEYARQCIKLNVYDFFLKPIDEKILIEAIKKQVTFLESKNNNKLNDINENRVLAFTEQINIEKFLRDLVHDRIPYEDAGITEFCKKYNYDINQNIQVAIIVPTLYMKNEKEADNFIALSIVNICIGMVDALSRGLTFMDDCGRIVIVYFLKKQKISIVEWIQELIGILKDEYNKKPKVVVGIPVNGLKNVSMSYNDAVNLLARETTEYEDIIQTKYIQEKCDLFKEVFFEMKCAMCSNLTDRDKALSIFERFSNATFSYNLSDSYTRQCCYELASSLYYSCIINSGAEADSRIIQFYNSLANVSGEESLELTRQFISKLLENKEDQSVDELVEKAKHYIKEHLSEELSLPDIASYLYISPNYLSRLFKKVIGEGCNQYIVRKRIEKAKLLLETTNLKTCKIAFLVGYRDTNYFSLAIKKSTGLSPVRYREMNQKSDRASREIGTKQAV